MKDRWMGTHIASSNLDAFLERAVREFTQDVNDLPSKQVRDTSPAANQTESASEHICNGSASPQ
jgi:hypothetical protein